MEFLNDIKIELQRWLYRTRRRRFKKTDDKLMLEAIEKAEKHTEKNGTRLWVVKISASDYRIYTKSQVKTFFRSVRHYLSDSNINYYQTNEYIVHITKKPK
jgi:hypothetical protein